MKGKTSAILVLFSVMAVGVAGYLTGVIDINPPDNSRESKTEYLTIYINSYNFTQILLQDFTINYTINGFGTFDLYQNKSRIGGNPQGAEGLKIYAWCSLNFTPATELKDQPELISLPH
ncbi:MAG: HU family DNA-binding protein [Promethearchaeota archaeon]